MNDEIKAELDTLKRRIAELEAVRTKPPLIHRILARIAKLKRGRK